MNSISILLVSVSGLVDLRDSLPKGSVVIEASNGHEALFTFSKYSPDLVFIEFDLPLMTGEEVARAIRSISPEVEVVLIAETLDSDSYLTAIGAGATHCLDAKILKAEINSLLERIVVNVAARREMKAGQSVLGHIFKGLHHVALLIDLGTMRILSSNDAASRLGLHKGNKCKGALFPANWYDYIVGSFMAGEEVCCRNRVLDAEVWKTTSVMTSGNTLFFMAEDVTGAVKAQERIKQSKSLLLAMFENSYDSIILFDNDQRVLKANHRVKDMFGYSETVIPSLTYNDLVLTLSFSEDNPNESFHAALEGDVQLFESKAIRADDGSEFNVEIFLRGFIVGNSPMVLASVRDVTERRRAEVGFISIQRQLGDLLVERKSALADLMELLNVEHSKCEILQNEMGQTHESYKQVLAAEGNVAPDRRISHFGHSNLSSRELQIVMEIAKGSSISAIAEDFQLSPKTVSTYKGRAMKKLNFASESELILYALRTGMIS